MRKSISIPLPTLPSLTRTKKMPDECCGNHHLARPQHAAPATVGGEAGVLQRWELAAVSAPDQGVEVPLECLHAMPLHLRCGGWISWFEVVGDGA